VSSQPPSEKELLVPTPLRLGDSVGIVAAAGPPDRTILDAGIQFLERTGFQPVRGCHINERNGYLAGTDDQRCRDLNSMLHDRQVRGIMIARGGYGTMRLLRTVDYQAVTADPKLLLGMSDVTALQLALYKRCGLVTLSGPMIAGQVGQTLDPLSEQWLMAALLNPLEGRNLWPPEPGVNVLRHGMANGVLLGGCLSLVTALLGTPYCPCYQGAILLLEEVGEPPYRVDRMFIQLKLAGILDSVAGMVLGHFLGPDGKSILEDAQRIVMELTSDNPIPLISGYPHGHTLPNLTIPNGAPVEFDTEAEKLVVCFSEGSSS
jgi:muramoyltetrapeptide carboxypeptidase